MWQVFFLGAVSVLMRDYKLYSYQNTFDYNKQDDKALEKKNNAVFVL